MEFLNAYTFGFCEKRGFTGGVAWRRSLEAMAQSTGCNAIILPVCAWQEHPWSTEIVSDSPHVMDEADVAAVCAFAKALGLKVILKAMVNCRDGAWRAFIHFFDPPVPTEPCWADWFASWTRHVCRVADMARANAADMLCIVPSVAMTAVEPGRSRIRTTSGASASPVCSPAEYAGPAAITSAI